MAKNEVLEAFGKLFQQTREGEGQSREQIGVLLDLTSQQVRRLEQGEVDPGLQKLVKLCDHFDLTMDYWDPRASAA